jgi:hypothetical protein
LSGAPSHFYRLISNYSFGEFKDPAQVDDIPESEVKIPGLSAGDYEVSFFDPKTGNESVGSVVTVVNDTLTISLPLFKKDIALKVSRVAVTGLYQAANTRPEVTRGQNFPNPLMA